MTHLCDMVQRNGPLTVQAAYSTENTMGIIARRVMSGTNVAQQTMKKITALQSITSTLASCKQENLSQPFINLISSLFPKLCSPKRLLNLKTFSSSYTPTQIEMDLLSPLDQKET